MTVKHIDISPYTADSVPCSRILPSTLRRTTYWTYRYVEGDAASVPRVPFTVCTLGSSSYVQKNGCKNNTRAQKVRPKKRGNLLTHIARTQARNRIFFHDTQDTDKGNRVDSFPFTEQHVKGFLHSHANPYPLAQVLAPPGVGKAYGGVCSHMLYIDRYGNYLI